MNFVSLEPEVMDVSAVAPEQNESTYDAEERKEDSGQKAFTFVCSLIMITLCIIGAFGNIVSAWIFTRQSMRSSINILLTGLSLVDLLVVVSAVPVFAVPGLNAYGQFGTLGSLQMAIVFGLYQAAVIAQTCSAYLFVLITVERYFAVCHPLHVQYVFTAQRAKVAQLMVFSLSFLYNLCRFWEYEMVYEDGRYGYIRSLRANKTYFLGYYTIAYLFVHFLVPFSLIAALNSRIANSIKFANVIRYKLTSMPVFDSPRQHQITRMIVAVTAIFAACNITPFCLNIWEAVFPASFAFSQNDQEWHLLAAYVVTEISNVLVVLNSSINFLIYLIYCRKYRRLFGKFLRRAYQCDGSRRESDASDSRSQTMIGVQQRQATRRSSAPRPSEAMWLFRRFTLVSHTFSMNSF